VRGGLGGGVGAFVFCALCCALRISDSGHKERFCACSYLWLVPLIITFITGLLAILAEVRLSSSDVSSRTGFRSPDSIES